jgi:hypothetical protein
MSAEKKPYIILPIIGVILAIVVGYFFGHSPVARLQGEIDQISTENLAMQSQIGQLEDNNTDLLEQLKMIAEDLSETQETYQTLLGYHELLGTFASTQSDIQNILTSFVELEIQFLEAKVNNSELIELYSNLWEQYSELVNSYNKVASEKPIGEMITTNITGVINGGFDDGGEGWVKQGLGGTTPYAHLNQYDQGSYVTQTIEIDDSELNIGLSFYVKPEPVGAEVRLELSFGGYLIFNQLYSGQSSTYEWENVIVPLRPLFRMKEMYGFNIEGYYSIRFTVPAGEENGARVLIDDVSLVKIEYQPEEP